MMGYGRLLILLPMINSSYTPIGAVEINKAKQCISFFFFFDSNFFPFSTFLFLLRQLHQTLPRNGDVRIGTMDPVSPTGRY